MKTAKPKRASKPAEHAVSSEPVVGCVEALQELVICRKVTGPRDLNSEITQLENINIGRSGGGQKTARGRKEEAERDYPEIRAEVAKLMRQGMGKTNAVFCVHKTGGFGVRKIWKALKESTSTR